MSMLDEFKAFALRGNVLDLAIGIIIGAAFGKIVSSLVDGILMPTLGLILGGIDLSGETAHFGSAVIKWGSFLQSVIDFTFIAFAVFILVKMLNRLHVQAPVALKPGPTEIGLLTEIRNLLASKK
jgi:large conductance mechanosensitive channel